MKKRIVTMLLAYAIALSAVIPAAAAAPVTRTATSAQVAQQYVMVKKASVADIVPSKALERVWIDGAYHWCVNVYKLEEMAGAVAQKGSFPSVSYSFRARVYKNGKWVWKNHTVGSSLSYVGIPGRNPAASHSTGIVNMKGWEQFGNKWKYFSCSTGVMFKGWHKIAGTWYYFSKTTGNWVKNKTR